ncbi:GNAT family N-acetyltransferase [Quisquiliibacterium transsilvanicum]|uniref:RimJ/RimL family protein N-acetyltransferase n=1 Tax=Quisquiliibacterium transsilvanicum TaxID=1549638 RepID=A0A7W8M770_9BURK|nr:GNAT family protein [Quisquiliibacterium transsilvanicum]MBB5270267.1 RimJ/RimL family protein N-acetyltransferase [Quisquiliibacterium transsilvanicum]
MSWLEPVTLRGAHATLEPLSPAHEAELASAVADGELWTLWFTHVPRPQAMGDEIERRLGLQRAGSMLPFSVRDNASGRLVGMSTYMNVDSTHRRVEIGSTWYAASVQRTPLNTNCKLMLLQHAFERLDCIAVEFRTHFMNRRSRQAIERLGAKLDGILRSHARMADGSLRDTAVYSVIAAEWPAVRTNLEWQLRRPRSAQGAAA